MFWYEPHSSYAFVHHMPLGQEILMFFAVSLVCKCSIGLEINLPMIKGCLKRDNEASRAKTTNDSPNKGIF